MPFVLYYDISPHQVDKKLRRRCTCGRIVLEKKWWRNRKIGGSQKGYGVMVEKWGEWHTGRTSMSFYSIHFTWFIRRLWWRCCEAIPAISIVEIIFCLCHPTRSSIALIEALPFSLWSGSVFSFFVSYIFFRFQVDRSVPVSNERQIGPTEHSIPSL